MAPSPADQTLDFALLQQARPRHAGRNRRALLWLLGFSGLLVGAVITLVLYLNSFETEEQERRRTTDAQWLEQTVQFHFRRLEDDLLVLARQVVLGSAPASDAAGAGSRVQGGLLWRQPGVVLSHGWMPASPLATEAMGPARWQADWGAHPANRQVLATMQDITRGLRRSAYAGPMRQADGTLTDVVWLAVPFFERGQFAGNYVAALAIDLAAQSLVPTWFADKQRVHLVNDEQGMPALGTPDGNAYRAAMNLSGTDLFLEVTPYVTAPATVPRIFFLVALLFLLGMLISLFALRRDFVKRQGVEALLQAEVALRSAMENSVTIGLRAWDMGGKILYVNDAFCRMVGYPSKDLLGRSAPLPYWPKDQADELGLLHRDIISQGTRGDGVEVQFQHRNGQLVDVLIHEAPLNTVDGEQIGWMSSVLDISERKRALRVAALQQDKLEASGRLVAVGEVASTLAHELNQPLGALSSFANGLLNRLHEDNITLQEMAPVVARMSALAERAGGIIQRVNAFARRREISRQPLDMMVVLRRVVASVADLQGCHLVLVDPGQPVWIDADGLLLEHLANNLVGNALDWAHRAGARAQVRVWVDRGSTSGMAAMVVADTGPGVADDDQAHIFNAFFSTKEGGMGMGLAICRSIAEAHHGRIEVGRDPVLGGARLTVWLPLGPAPQAAHTG